MKPPEKVKPCFTPRMFRTAKESPANRECITKRMGAAKANADSTGSVMPHAAHLLAAFQASLVGHHQAPGEAGQPRDAVASRQPQPHRRGEDHRQV